MSSLSRHQSDGDEPFYASGCEEDRFVRRRTVQAYGPCPELAEPAGGGCLSAWTLTHFARGTELAPEERREVEAHLRECRRCRDLEGVARHRVEHPDHPVYHQPENWPEPVPGAEEVFARARRELEAHGGDVLAALFRSGPVTDAEMSGESLESQRSPEPPVGSRRASDAYVLHAAAGSKAASPGEPAHRPYRHVEIEGTEYPAFNERGRVFIKDVPPIAVALRLGEDTFTLAATSAFGGSHEVVGIGRGDFDDVLKDLAGLPGIGAVRFIRSPETES